ncbi:hypothetical protein ACFLV6_04005, partial [Chloroflexota bacterium]
ILMIIVLSSILSCGPSSDDPATQTSSVEGEIVQLVNHITQAESDEQRRDAINEVVEQGRSLGLLDDNGNQFNPNVPDDAISLTPEDIASFSTFVEIGQYSTIGDMVDYLAETGVVLSSTGAVITLVDFLPDLQEYIDWSFENSDHTDSQLGILLASGADMQTPPSAPVIESSTQISPMAGVLMLGDILIGTGDEKETTSRNWFGKAAYAADVQQTAIRIQGLITKIESGLKPAQSTISFLRKAGELTGFLEESKEPPQEIKVPDIAKKIIGAFALGSHFAVRMHSFKAVSSTATKDYPILKSFEIDQIGESNVVILSLVLVSSDKSAPVTILEDEIPIMYSVRLLSPGETGVGTDLYPDANAILSPYGIIASTASWILRRQTTR